MKKASLNIDTEYNKDIEIAAMTIAPLYNMFGWTWWFEDGLRRVPNLEDIKDDLEDKVRRVVENGEVGFGISSGRIKVELLSDGDCDYIEMSLDIGNIYDDRA